MYYNIMHSTTKFPQNQIYQINKTHSFCTWVMSMISCFFLDLSAIALNSFEQLWTPDAEFETDACSFSQY